MKNKILSFLGIFAIIFVGFITSVNAASNLTKVDKKYEQYLESNWTRVELATKVYNRIADYYNIKEAYKDIYPSYFGGMYISDDASKLIIQIVKNNIPNEDSKEHLIYKEIINMDSSIQIEYVETSFNELNEVNNYISENLSTSKSTNENIKSSYLDIMNNVVGVELVNNSKSNQELFKNATLASENSKMAMNQKLIKFSQAKEYTSSANINAGGQIFLKSGSTGYCSMGMRVNYKGKNGYLTAGHCAKGYSSFPSGSVKVVQFANNQKYDYAFIQTNSSYTPTNNLAYSTTGITKLGLISYCPFVSVNMAVAKSGARTGYTSGKVTGVNVSVYYSDVNVTLKSMIKTNVYQGKGDSGGIVMIPRTDANGGAIGLGILSGGVDLGNEMYFSDMNVYPTGLQNRY